MKYSFTVAALVSMAAGSLAGGHGHAHAHERLHAREAEAVAEAKPEPTDYSWSDGQCFGTWGCMSKTGAAAAAPSADDVQAQAKQAAPAKATPATTTLAQAAKPASSASAPASSATGGSSSGDSSSDSGSASSVMKAITSKGMKQPASSSNLVGTDSSAGPNKCSISNQSGKDMLYVCWGSAGSWVNAQAPIIAQSIKSGGSSTLYFANTPSGQQGPGCAAVFEDTQMSNGQIKNTWIEHTFNQYGTLDISKEVTMSGTSMSAKSGDCTSNMNQCVFVCTNGQDTCGDAGTYKIQPGPNCNTGDSSGMNGGCPISGNSFSVTIG